MSFKTQAAMADDRQLLARVGACAAREGIKPNPLGWAYEHAWQLAAIPGWDEAYAESITAGTALPGDDEDVIRDDMILAGVRDIRAAEAETLGEEPE